MFSLFRGFLPAPWFGAVSRASIVPFFSCLRVFWCPFQILKTLIMAPKRRGIRARMYDERALLRQAKAIIKPVGRFLRRDPQRSRTTISTDLLGNPYNNHCREPSHQRLVHPRFHAGRSRAGLQALRTDPDPSPSRGSHPPASLRRKVSL